VISFEKAERRTIPVTFLVASKMVRARKQKLNESSDGSQIAMWADAFPAVGSKSLRGPGRCRFDGRIVQRPCMPRERFPRGVFSAEIFTQLDVI
jgi:hypothetical protein